MEDKPSQFDEETWTVLPDYLAYLPEPVRLHVWGDEQASESEKEAAQLVRVLAKRFEDIDYRLLPRRINYNYYPVIGVMGLDGNEVVDHGLRFIGLPAGVQITSLIAAIQSVAFRGMTSEAKTRIQLRRLEKDVTLELITSADDEAGTIIAHKINNMAIVSPWIRTYIIMTDAFPHTLYRYSVSRIPHLVINERTHLEGMVDEETILHHIAAAIRSAG
jgi:alkyl hydroperoxide reductase subunit AhpF